METLIFVYNANSGYFNMVMDIGHKIFSPATYPCSLCELTYGIFKIKPEWDIFIKEMSIPILFLHKDEFINQFPELKTLDLPVILIKKSGFVPECLFTHTELNKIPTIASLKTILIDRMGKF